MKLIEPELPEIRGEYLFRDPLVHSISRSSEARMSVVGGGFCGTLAIVQIISDYTSRARENPAIPNLSIHWFDPTRFFARGTAYRSQSLNEDDAVFLLNQPAERMSPFVDDPDHFSRWIEQRGLGNRFTFATRALYGRYLESLLFESIKSAPETFNLQLIPERVREVLTSDPLEPVIHTNKGKCVVGDSVILALGHAVRDGFQILHGSPGYLNSLWDIGSYRELIHRHPHASVVTLIGGGPSTIDAIRAFEHVGFKGRYQIISSAIAEPWNFDPKLYSDQSFIEYKKSNCLGLTAAWISRNQDYLRLHRALRQDIKRARYAGFGEGHVYYSIDIDFIEQLAREQANAHQREQLVRFGNMLSHLRGSLASPESYELLQDLKSTGRSRWVKGRADSHCSFFDASTGRYHLIVHGRTRDVILVQSDIVANCAQIGSNQTELNDVLAKTDTLSRQRVHLMGPSSIDHRLIPGQHGVERYRGAVTNLSLKALRQGLGIEN